MEFFKRLFGEKVSREKPPEAEKTTPLEPGEAQEQVPQEFPKHILIGTSQSTGIERKHNEDALFVLLGSASGQQSIPEFGMFVVADGMGGHRSGEVASAISIRAVARRLTEDTILHLFELNLEQDTIPLQDIVRKALENANQTVVDHVPGGGSTLTAALILGQQMTIGHVGDSRAYIISDHQTKVLTRDHSLVKRLEELGQLTEEEAAIHPQRNVLYKAIGQGANLEVDVFTHPLPHKGYLLLCSDGLWGVVPDDEITRIVYETENPQEASDELVRMANVAGGPDNITAVLVYFP